MPTLSNVVNSVWCNWKIYLCHTLAFGCKGKLCITKMTSKEYYYYKDNRQDSLYIISETYIHSFLIMRYMWIPEFHLFICFERSRVGYFLNYLLVIHNFLSVFQKFFIWELFWPIFWAVPVIKMRQIWFGWICCRVCTPVLTFTFNFVGNNRCHDLLFSARKLRI